MIEKKDNSKDNEHEEESLIVQIFKRVVTDEEFKKQIIEDPDEALKDYELSEVQMMMIKNLTKEDFEKLTSENLEEFFAADAAVYTPDEEEMLNEEAYSPDDFEEIDNNDDGEKKEE